MKDKYNMTQEQNLFLAKRNIVDSMWKSANLEGIAITFPETQAIYDGMNIAKFRIDEIQTINNLKHAWQFVLSSIDQELDFNYLSSIHSLVGSNIVDSPGNLRTFEVGMGGTSWRPELPTKEKVEQILNCNNNLESSTEKIITMMLRLMKLQAFNDGNKRTAMLVANHELIKNGNGILSIAEENKIEFGEKLIQFYEDENNLEDLKQFIFDKCLSGI
ncbi:MAG: Fic family protein [Clostridia bacterium]|nr:Fic family protein [Clostridia bacterium]